MALAGNNIFFSLQFCVHVCTPPREPNEYKQYVGNSSQLSMVDLLLNQIPRLVTSIREILDRTASKRDPLEIEEEKNKRLLDSTKPEKRNLLLNNVACRDDRLLQLI